MLTATVLLESEEEEESELKATLSTATIALESMLTATVLLEPEAEEELKATLSKSATRLVESMLTDAKVEFSLEEELKDSIWLFIRTSSAFDDALLSLTSEFDSISSLLSTSSEMFS